MSNRTFVEWQAYCELEPFGPPAEFWRAGLIASILANVHRAKNRGKVFQPEDFMPESMKTERVAHDDETEAAILKARLQAYGEQVKRQGGHG